MRCYGTGLRVCMAGAPCNQHQRQVRLAGQHVLPARATRPALVGSRKRVGGGQPGGLFKAQAAARAPCQRSVQALSGKPVFGRGALDARAADVIADFEQRSANHQHAAQQHAGINRACAQQRGRDCSKQHL